MFEDTEIVHSRGHSSNGAENDMNDSFIVSSQMEDLYDKLKLLNHEVDFIKQHKLRPLNRYVFGLFRIAEGKICSE